ncbi:glutaminyl-peptide cyclotransferase [Geodermatophilus maliterrae]|uniref:Glutaminyl-peptide cyclotransferase n=1 Tax=Geodermatophilus maliterrae TaxID=3162531 RepID=A0ABV3XK14_9ACTN
MTQTVQPSSLAGEPAAALDDHVRRLAEGTELLGAYADSGYEEPKYLVSRADGQVMQLPELLYRVAESLDGSSAGEVAADLSARLGRELTAEQVLYLVDERLRPVGLIARDATEAGDAGAAPAPVRADPLLGLRYRVDLVPERVARRIAVLFRPLFLRPVWIAAMAAFVAVDVAILAQGDLVGRLAASVTQFVHRPGLTLLLLALVLLSGGFHECGHTAACQFGGARPGTMGVGVYLVWPAFYSTVTDSYRLSRTGRLRTDLGGVYFNAIVMTAVGLAYLGTGQAWLLLAVFAMHLETTRQFLPLLRFDGYYMLADLIGVPDLFGYVGPVLKSLVPGRPADPRLRALRPRARRLIALWVAVAVPVLTYYLVVLLLVLPRVLPVVWQAALQYGEGMQTALGQGDLTRVVLSVLQLVLFLVPWVGMVLILGMFWQLLRRVVVSWGWTWAAPGRWAAAGRWAVPVGLGLLGAALVLRVTAVALSAPLSPAEARIGASAAGVLDVGRAAAPAVGPGETVVRDQLAAYAGLTGAFDRHADVLSGGRELAVLAVLVLVTCLLLVSVIHHWRPMAVAVPLAAVAAMGPAVSALATLGPAVVGAAWVAAGSTALALAARDRGDDGDRQVQLLHRLLAGVGAVAVAVGIATAPLLGIPLSVAAVLVVVRRGAGPGPVRWWTPLAVAAFGVTVLTALVAPVLLRTRAGTVLSVPEQQVLAVTTLLVVAAVATMRELRWAAVVLGSLVVVALLPAPGAVAVLPLALCAAAVLAALAVHALVRQRAAERPHPLVRTGLVAPALLLVLVGTLFVPAASPQAAEQYLTSRSTAASASTPEVPVLRAEVLAEVPHDPSAFTQGLQLDGDVLYEGTGLEGRSELRELDPATGEVRRAVPLPGQMFGEGITVAGDSVWQLTWRDGVVLEWDRATLTLRRQLPLAGEGWGLCSDGARLVRSDGSDRLYFHDPGTFAGTGSVAVTLRGTPVTRLNELECVGGEVWANVWQTDELVRIDPDTGAVTAVVNAAGLLDPQRRADPNAVLNGIAALGDDQYLLTGKLWPVSFRVRFTPM